MWISVQTKDTVTGRQPEHIHRPEGPWLPGLKNWKYCYPAGMDGGKIIILHLVLNYPKNLDR